MKTNAPDTTRHCAYCGNTVTEEASAPERFGERFCSEAHAEEFVAGVRAARMQAAARPEKTEVHSGTKGGDACALASPTQRGWSAYLKRSACWGAPVLLLVALPLIWSGGWVATGGSLLSVLALLACPVGMYFMMRGMMSMQHQDKGPETTGSNENDRA